MAKQKFPFNDYIRLAKRTRADLPSVWDNNIHMILGMATEVAEIQDVFKKALAYGKSLDMVNLQEEIGDIMWYIAGFCDINGFDFEQILEVNIKKLIQRYPDKFSKKDALNRNLEKERRSLEELGY